MPRPVCFDSCDVNILRRARGSLTIVVTLYETPGAGGIWSPGALDIYFEASESPVMTAVIPNRKRRLVASSSAPASRRHPSLLERPRGVISVHLNAAAAPMVCLIVAIVAIRTSLVAFQAPGAAKSLRATPRVAPGQPRRTLGGSVTPAGPRSARGNFQGWGASDGETHAGDSAGALGRRQRRRRSGGPRASSREAGLQGRRSAQRATSGAPHGSPRGSPDARRQGDFGDGAMPARPLAPRIFKNFRGGRSACGPWGRRP